MRLLGVTFWLTLFVTLLASSITSATDEIPLNGSFTGGVRGWTDQSSGKCQFSSSGHNAAGSLNAIDNGCYPVSAVVRVGGADSVLTFWHKHSGCSQGYVGVYSFALATETHLYDWNSCNSWDWTQETVSLGAYVGGDIAITAHLWVVDYLDDVAVTDASNESLYSQVNGEMSSLWGWHVESWYGSSGGCIPALDLGFGGPAPSLFSCGWNGGGSLAWSAPFVPSSGSWSSYWYTNGGGSYHFYVCNLDSASFSCSSLETGSLTAGYWQAKSFTLTGVVGHMVMLGVAWDGLSNGQETWVDDICPVSGCAGGTPTVTPTSAGGSPTQLPYPTLPNWLLTPYPTMVFPTQLPYPTFPAFPTQVAYPTFPAFPTQVAYPTVDFGYSTPYVVTFNGTPQPVYITGTVVVTGNVTVMNWPTPMYGKDTPVPVYMPTKVTTPWAVPTNAGSGGVNGVSVPQVIGSADTRDISGVMPLGTGGSAPSWAMPGVALEENQLQFCLPSEVTRIISGVPLCATFSVFNVTRLNFLNIDLAPAFATVFVVLFIVMVIRQIQAR